MFIFALDEIVKRVTNLYDTNTVLRLIIIQVTVSRGFYRSKT